VRDQFKIVAAGFTGLGIQGNNGFFCSPKIEVAERSNRFKIIRRLGEGGCASVFEVIDEQGNRFALKAIPMDGDELEIRIREIEAMKAAQDSDNVVRLHDAWIEKMTPDLEKEFVPVDSPAYQYETSDYMLFVKTELMEQNLTQWLRRPSRRNSQVMGVFRQVVNGIREMHTSDYMHRDIKPDNIFLRRDTNQNLQVKIGDLGLAKRHRHVSFSFSSRNVKGMLTSFLKSNECTSSIGTYAYMAPEQRHSFYDNKVDIYALGMILWELNETEHDKDERHFTLVNLRRTGSCEQCNLRIPNAAELIERMLERDPSNRPTAKQVLELVDQMS